MSTPIEHAQLSAQRFGGKPEDYLKIHELMDSSKSAHADLRHRCATHNSWFVTNILELIFGKEVKNSDGLKVSVRDIGQYHVMEDFSGSYPSLTDFASEINFRSWMDNGEGNEVPPSNIGLPSMDLEKLYRPTPPTPRKKKEKKPSSALPQPFQPPGRRSCGGSGRID